MKDVSAEIVKLKAEIAKHDEAYHSFDSPLISDSEYDKLRKRLENFQKDYPQFFDRDDQKVGGKTLEIFGKIKHSKPKHI